MKNTDSDTLIDIDGNVYKTVKIGEQIWMAENLNVVHYRNGDPIPQVQGMDEWSNLTTGAWCYYDNNPYISKKFGILYNWYAVKSRSKLAPVGWHVPTDDEWQTLVDYLGGESVAGDKLKETGTSHWEGNNKNATNDSGFSALAGGYRDVAGDFGILGEIAGFWSSTENYSTHASLRSLYYWNSNVGHASNTKKSGYSVRLVRN